MSTVLALTASAQRPNIILILMDDFGYNDLGVQTYPSPTNYYPNAGPPPQYNISDPDPDIPEPNQARLLTPSIDTMAAEGMRMTAFHSSPVCSPSRASLLTGRYDRRVNINSVFRDTLNTGLNTKEVTLPEVLRELGYVTGMVGKWHLGYYKDAANPFQYMPLRHGFEEFFGVPHSNDMSSFHLIENETVLIPDFKSAEEQAQLTWRYTERALDFIERQTAVDKPFFLYIAHTMPHIPTYPSDQTYPNADGSTWPKFQGASGISSYYDIVMEVDHSIRRIFEKLAALGIDENTIVIFTSDNGPWQRHSNINLTNHAVGSAYPLRDSKSQTWEGGCRVPFIVRWPGQIPAGTVSGEPAGLVDLLPTLVGLAGGAAPADRTIDGIDLAPLWTGQPGWVSPRMSYALFKGNNLSAVIKENWKLRSGKLYNLATDIQESTDLAAIETNVLAELEAEFTRVTNSIHAENQPRGLFTDFEVELSTDAVSVPEGSNASFQVRLSADPATNVTVNTAWFSGDADLAVTSGSALSFNSGSWSNWQPVTLAAAQDADDDPHGATFRVSSPEIDAIREVFATEADDEALPAAVGSLIWPKVDTALIDSSNVTLVAEGSLQLGAETDPTNSIYGWHKIFGPGTVGFTDAAAAKTGVSFSQDGVYKLRFIADHPGAGSFGAADFTAYVGVAPPVTREWKYSPTLAYVATLDTNGNSLWENELSPGTRDWALAAGVNRTVTDPAPQLAFIDAAWNFPGGSIPAGATSLDFNGYSTGDASIEIWFKPVVLPVASKQVLWETGGDIGASLTLEGSLLRFTVDDGSSGATNGAVAEATLSPSAAQDGFIHCMGVIDLASDEIRLYLDGALVDTKAIPTVADWCGNSDTALGTIADSNGAETGNFGHLGGNDLLSGSHNTFSGQVAQVQFFDQALSNSVVADLASGLDLSVETGNVGPVVTAGADQSVSYTNGAALNGTVGDDGLPAGSAVSSRWYMVAGPGIAAFDNTSSVSTHATFDLPGTYRIWLEADDSEIKVFDETQITVASLTYGEWAAGIAFPAGEGDPADNPDGDQFINLWEWTLGLNPIVDDSPAAGISQQVVTSNNVPRFLFEFDIPRNRVPNLALEGSEDLWIWDPLPGVVPEVQIIDGATERWSFSLEKDPGVFPKYFIRGAVTP